jgi:hypothetical protein
VSPSQAAIGLAPETVTNGPVVEGSAVAGTEPTTARATMDAASAAILFLARCIQRLLVADSADSAEKKGQNNLRTPQPSMSTNGGQREESAKLALRR